MSHAIKQTDFDQKRMDGDNPLARLGLDILVVLGVDVETHDAVNLADA